MIAGVLCKIQLKSSALLSFTSFCSKLPDNLKRFRRRGPTEKMGNKNSHQFPLKGELS